MSDIEWEKRVTHFLKKTGEDFKRTGEELKVEAQRLIGEVRDPRNQQRIKDTLVHLGGWARKRAEDAAVMVEAAVKKAEGALRQASSRVGIPTPSAESPRSAPTQPASAAAAAPEARARPARAKSPAKKPARARPAKTARKKQK